MLGGRAFTDKKQGRRHKGYEPPLSNERENTVARAQLAAKSGLIPGKAIHAVVENDIYFCSKLSTGTGLPKR